MIQILKGDIAYTKIKDKFEFIENGYIVVQDALVAGVYRHLPAQYETVPVTDYSGKLIIPGFVDAHVHPCQMPNIGLGYDMELLPWLDVYTYRQEGRFADIAYAKTVYSAYIEEIWKYGVTRSIAMATTHKEATILLMELFEKAGLGAYVGKVNQDCNCGKPEFMEDTQTSIRLTEEWLDETMGRFKGVKPILTPTINIICTERLMEAVGKLADRYNLPVQAHLSENRTEVEFCKKLYPGDADFGSVYDRFHLFGTHPTMMAHCIYTTQKEMDLMRDRKILAAHCPCSNFNLSSGVMKVRNYLDAGIPVGIGSDIAGGDTLSPMANIARTIQASKFLWVLDENMSRVTTSEAFYMATKGGGSFFGKVGSFEEGYEFDALVIDESEKNRMREYSMQERIERFIYNGDDRSIEKRYCAGKELPHPQFG